MIRAVFARGGFLLALAGVVAISGRAGAQASAPTCLDSIPASELRRAIVFLTSWREDSTSPSARIMEPIVDLYAQSVAQEIRARLGAKEGELPPGEPRLTWRSSGEVRLVAHRDGSVSASRDTDEISRVLSDGGAPRLIVEAVDSIRARGEPFVWPEDVTGDSLVFALRADDDVAGSALVEALAAPRITFPVYTIGVPHVTPVSTLASSPGPHYPEQLRRRNMTGTVLARYVVSAEGRYVRGSFRDATAESMHLPEAMLGGTQPEFAKAVKEALPRMYFRPAMAWHCPIPERVQQPFTFDLTEAPVRTLSPYMIRRP